LLASPAYGSVRVRSWHGVAGEAAILPSALCILATLPALCRHGVRGIRGGVARASKIHDRRSTPIMPRSSAQTPATATYEQALGELERLVQAMEGGQMPLDQLLASYRRGAELLQLCRTRLQTVEEQVKLLEDGQLKPWAAA
jgi:exodeoxyribonuclease VII small subunit